VLAYPSRSLRHVTAHTLSLVRPELEAGWSLLDVGCGAGFVAAELAGERPVLGLDIVDGRRGPLDAFARWDGLRLPVADGSWDAVLFAFVLHHVPDERKAAVVAEARRVARRRVLVLEDTPVTPLDWAAAWLHGRRHRAEIGSAAGFGFKSHAGWERWFGDHGLRVARSARLSRLARDWYRPWARGWFVLEPAP
jgi:SAM-dependent methyltransferase